MSLCGNKSFISQFIYVCVLSVYRYPNAQLTFEEVQRTLQNIRKETMPPPPKTVDEINAVFSIKEVMDEYGYSKFNSAENQLPFFHHAYTCDQFAYCIFASLSIIQMMVDSIPESARILLLDATFKVVPFGEFNQLLIIHVEYLEKVILLHMNFCRFTHQFLPIYT